MRGKVIAIAMGLLASTTLAFAGGHASKEDAIAMVKKAVATIKSEGTGKAYPEIDKVGGPFSQGDLYVAVLDFKGVTLAHGANHKLIGKSLIAVPDVDGKLFVKAMVDNAQKEPTFWVDYKFVNPTTKKIEPKSMYCERLDETIVCAGIYKS